jgi:N-acyl-L-homoserine lactone synthetase
MVSIKKRIYFAHAYTYVKTNKFTIGDVGVKNNLQLLEAFTQLRTDYVLQENWPIHHSGVDFDEYDGHLDTQYVVASAGNQVVAGMRLTPVDNIESSMSFGMWNNADDKTSFQAQYQDSINKISIDEQEQLWDITRLVTEANILATQSTKKKVESRAGLLKILAAAATIKHDHKGAVWVFTTTQKMRQFMERNSFKVTVIASGVISKSDGYESSLCIIRPHEVISHLKRHKPVLYQIAQHESRRLKT